MPIFKFGENNAIAAQLPFLTAELVCSEDRQYATIESALPLLEGSLLFQADIVAKLPSINGYVLQQQNATISAYVPLITSELIAYQEVHADISAEIPFVTALIFETNRIEASIPMIGASMFVSAHNYATITATMPSISAFLQVVDSQYADIVASIPILSATVFISDVNISAEINATMPSIFGIIGVNGGYSVNTIGEDYILKFEERRRYI